MFNGVEEEKVTKVAVGQKEPGWMALSFGTLTIFDGSDSRYGI